MRYLNYMLLLLGLIIFSSCDISENEDVDPTLSFLKIYDSNQFDSSFEPIDVIQTGTGGFIVLGGYRREDSDFLGAYLLKADSAGNFVNDSFLPQEFVHPIGELMEFGGQYYFVGMDAIGLNATLNRVSENGELVESTSLGVTYPMDVKTDGTDRFVLLSYDNVGKNTVITVFNSGGGIVDQSEFGIGAGDEVEEPIIEHFTRTGRQLPFFVGRTNEGVYFLNGFYNFTLSLLFTNLNGNDPVGVIQGQQDQGGLSGVLPIAGDQFAVSKFSFGDNSVNARATLNTTGISSSVDIEGNPMIEWIDDAPVRMIEADIDNTSYIIMASTTNGQRISLHFYDRTSGNFVATEYLGFSTPYQMGSLELTIDEGLAVLGRTQVAGRFNRLCLFKLSADELRKIVR